jgi:thiamine biosynthesis lipoprotein
MKSVEFRAMGCGMSARIEGEHGALLDRVPHWFRAWERRLGRFSPRSELSRLNASLEERVTVSPALADAIHAALSASQWTHGAVTPTLLDALERAGYDRSFDEMTRAQVTDDVAAAYDASAGEVGETKERMVPRALSAKVSVELASRVVTRPPGLRLDLGGTAKGRCADRAAARLGRSGPALVDAGGDVAVSGPRRDGRPWLVSVESPIDRRPLALLEIDRGGVATSGRDRRVWTRDGRAMHHVIDPETGLPAVTDVLSATVIAESALQAETAAKMALLLGRSRGLAWLEQEGLAGLVVDDAGHVHETALDLFLAA